VPNSGFYESHIDFSFFTLFTYFEAKNAQEISQKNWEKTFVNDNHMQNH
jgi:hypothetical protein